MDRFMAAPIEEARLGLVEGGIPIGSVRVREDHIIGRGNNHRVQEESPVLHAEMDCLRNAGCTGSYRATVLYSTLMPCYLCAIAVVQFRIPKVMVGESETFAGAREFMVFHGVEVTVDLDIPVCMQMMRRFVTERPDLRNEDIGAE